MATGLIEDVAHIFPQLLDIFFHLPIISNPYSHEVFQTLDVYFQIVETFLDDVLRWNGPMPLRSMPTKWRRLLLRKSWVIL